MSARGFDDEQAELSGGRRRGGPPAAVRFTDGSHSSRRLISSMMRFPWHGFGQHSTCKRCARRSSRARRGLGVAAAHQDRRRRGRRDGWRGSVPMTSSVGGVVGCSTQGEEVTIGLEGVEGDGHRQVGRRKAPGKGRGAGAFRTPAPWGVSRRRLPSGRRRPSSRPWRQRRPRRLSSLRR